MEDLLIEILSKEFGYPVNLQGSFKPDETYPPNFFTFWNNAADGEGFFDNDETSILWQYSLFFYSSDPMKVNSELLKAKKVLKAAGFSVYGAGYSVMSDEPTHTGRGIDVSFRQDL